MFAFCSLIILKADDARAAGSHNFSWPGSTAWRICNWGCLRDFSRPRTGLEA
jgi:hypothetical protein